MADIDEMYRRASEGVTGMSPDLAAFRDEFPLIWSIFEGRPYTATDPGRPPATIILCAEGGRLKFVVKPKHGGMVAFGTILDPSKGLQGLEDALQRGDLEWKKSRRGG